MGGIISEPCRLDPKPHSFLSHSGEYRTGAETADTDGIFRHGTRRGGTGAGSQACAAEAAAKNGLRACHWRLAAETLFHGTGRFGGHCAAERLSSGELHGRFLRCGGVSGRDLYWQELLHPSGAARLFPGAADTYHTEPLFLFCQSRNTGHRMQSFRSAAVGGRAAGKGV